MVKKIKNIRLKQIVSTDTPVSVARDIHSKTRKKTRMNGNTCPTEQAFTKPAFHILVSLRTSPYQ